MRSKKIHVSVADGTCFFHVLGDSVRYYDLDSLLLKHPELAEYVTENKFPLMEKLMKQRELMGITEKF